jgi:hypothetical protein
MALRKVFRPADRRKTILIWTALAIVISGLFPPWVYTFDKGSTSDAAGGHWDVSAGYACIFKPPPAGLEPFFRSDQYGPFAVPAGTKLDMARLVVEWGCILAVSGAAWGLVRLNREQASEGYQKHANSSVGGGLPGPREAGIPKCVDEHHTL